MDAAIPFSRARAELSSLLDGTQHHGTRVLISRNGKPSGALVSPEDLARLEALEEAHDAALAEVRLAEHKDGGEATISAAEVFKKLDW